MADHPHAADVPGTRLHVSRLARHEEAEARKAFGERYTHYAAATSAFSPVLVVDDCVVFQGQPSEGDLRSFFSHAGTR